MSLEKSNDHIFLKLVVSALLFFSLPNMSFSLSTFKVCIGLCEPLYALIIV